MCVCGRKVPGLPVLEGIDSPHQFAQNDLMYRVLVSPWGPIPGLCDLNNAFLFDALDEDGSVVIYAQSPPEGATHHREWPLPPLGKNRKRNVISGLALIASPTRAWREGSKGCGSGCGSGCSSCNSSGGSSSDGGLDVGVCRPATQPASSVVCCRSPGCAFAARLATGGYCCERCRERPREHGPHCTGWLPWSGEIDVEACCRVKLPVPRWLLPPPLIRWLVPKLIAKVFWPKLVDVSHHFDESPFGGRYREDARGFYRACASRMPLEWPAEGGDMPPLLPAESRGLSSSSNGGGTPRPHATSRCATATTTAPPDAQRVDGGMGNAAVGWRLHAAAACDACSPSSNGFDDLSPDIRGAAHSAERLALVADDSYDEAGASPAATGVEVEVEEPPTLADAARPRRVHKSLDL